MALRERIKWMLYPGFNLHARLRRRILPAYFGSAVEGQDRLVLDAGCGNGMLSYESFKKGNSVTGISIQELEVNKCRRLFNEFLGLPESGLRFVQHNIYDVSSLNTIYDEIICSETLEHIDRDKEVCRSFSEILKPGGILHLCTPNAVHPHHVNYRLDPHETGDHVRPGYTFESFAEILEPIGFEIVDRTALGGPIRQAFNSRIIAGERKYGKLYALILFALGLPLSLFDGKKPNVPYSVYVKAVKKK